MHAVPRKHTPSEDEEEDLPIGPPPIGQPALFSLRLYWAGLLLVGAVLWVAGYRFVQGWWQDEYAARWTILSGLGLALLLWQLWRTLPQNHRLNEDTLLPGMGQDAALTFWRGVLISGLLGFLISPQPPGWQAWLPGGIFAAGMLLRPVTGWLTRQERRATLLGKNLEALVDLVSLLTGTLLVVQYGRAPWWYLLVAAGHGLVFAGVWLRQHQGQPVQAMRRSGLHRILAALEYALLFFLLLPLFSPPLTTIFASILMLVLLFSLWQDSQLASRAG